MFLVLLIYLISTRHIQETIHDTKILLIQNKFKVRFYGLLESL